MFYALLGATFCIALVVSLVTARFFDAAVKKILERIVGNELADAWRRYLVFAMIVVGVSGGVRLWEIEKYITVSKESPVPLNGMRWTLEIYRTLIETLQSIAWMLLLFFMCTMIAYVIVQVLEKKEK